MTLIYIEIGILKTRPVHDDDDWDKEVSLQVVQVKIKNLSHN